MADNTSRPVIHGRTYYMNFRLNDSTSFAPRRAGAGNLKQTQRFGQADFSGRRPLIPGIGELNVAIHDTPGDFFILNTDAFYMIHFIVAR